MFKPLRPLLLIFALSAQAGDVVYRRDVMALLSKAGCNAGGCHGNGQGKGGLKISLRGQDADLDWLAMVRDQGGRRVNLLEPERSLLLQKATAQLAHEGGQRFAVDSPEYEILRAWIADGAPDSGAELRLTKLDVTPRSAVLIEPEEAAQFAVSATFSDGTTRDVTGLAVYEPNNLGAKASAGGRVTREAFGETTVLVRYLGKQVPVTINFVPSRAFTWANPPAGNFVDEVVFKKLARLRVNPSELCSDELFVRRASLDLLGLVPSAEETRAFLDDPAPDKRARLVERLLTRGEFADFWAMKWADLLRIEERQLDRNGVAVFHGWIRKCIAENMPVDEFARELVGARGSTYKNPPANWYRANRDPVQRAENTARVFLGTQLNCAQCHNHPFERWTQDDYYNWAALFARVDYVVKDNKRSDKSDKHEFNGDQFVTLKALGSVLNPRTGQPATMRFLGGGKPVITPRSSELASLAEWLSHSPMFARMQVNRVWFNLFGRGLVDPVDDFRASNPPSHPELLDALTRDFVEHGYDLRHLIRTIMASRTYQLDATPNATNRDDETLFSRAIVRRLGAEQLIDSMGRALGAPIEIDGFPAGTRLTQTPAGRKHYKPLTTDADRFSATFGKPPRLVTSECERSNEVALPQVFQLASGPLVQQILTNKDNLIGQLLGAGKADGEVVDALSWAVLTRAPGAAEREKFYGHLGAPGDKRRAAEDVAWALLNSKEFIFRR
ncbi:MAG: DUF1549 and DUF1553 domain-containing protein [Chthoniobacteraceae bacterium]